MNADEAAKHCADLVRANNRPRFVASLFAPEEIRRRLFALYAFDAELLRIPAAAPEPMVAAMRFQWWREALSPTIQGDRGHPVLSELARAEGGSFAIDHLLAIIDAREDGSGSAEDAEKAEKAVVTAAAVQCGASNGQNPMANLAGSAIATQSPAILGEARVLWTRERNDRKAQLPAYLPATFIEMRHPVSALALYWRALVKAMRNRL